MCDLVDNEMLITTTMLLPPEQDNCSPDIFFLFFFWHETKGAVFHKSKMGRRENHCHGLFAFSDDRVQRCTINRFTKHNKQTHWSKCFEKPAKGIASRNPAWPMPAYQCPLARRNQKVGSPGRIWRRLCAGSNRYLWPIVLAKL